MNKTKKPGDDGFLHWAPGYSDFILVSFVEQELSRMARNLCSQPWFPRDFAKVDEPLLRLMCAHRATWWCPAPLRNAGKVRSLPRLVLDDRGVILAKSDLPDAPAEDLMDIFAVILRDVWQELGLAKGFLGRGDIELMATGEPKP